MDFSANNFLIAELCSSKALQSSHLPPWQAQRPISLRLTGETGRPRPLNSALLPLRPSAARLPTPPLIAASSSVGTGRTYTGNNAVVTFPPPMLQTQTWPRPIYGISFRRRDWQHHHHHPGLRLLRHQHKPLHCRPDRYHWQHDGRRFTFRRALLSATIFRHTASSKEPGSVFGMGVVDDISDSAPEAKWRIGQLIITGNNSASLTVDSNDNATLVNNRDSLRIRPSPSHSRRQVEASSRFQAA